MAKRQQKDTWRAACLGSTMLLAMPSAALARTDDDTDATPGADESAGRATDVITVTAQRREQNVQEVPISITAHTAAHLDNLRVDDSALLGEITPGLEFNESLQFPTPAIRGISSATNSAGGEAGVSIYVDGIYQPFPIGHSFELNDVERVEVLRGPQSALYGRNAMGGALNIVTRDPRQRPGVEGEISYGNFNTRGVKLYAGHDAGSIGFGISALYNDTDGFYHDIINGGDAGGVENFAVHAKVTGDIGSSYSYQLDLNHSYRSDGLSMVQSVYGGNTNALAYDPLPIIADQPYQVSANLRNNILSRNTSVGLIQKLELGSVELTSVTGYQNTNAMPRADADATSFTIVHLFNMTQDSENFYQELYAQSRTPGPFQWIVGGVYFHDDSSITVDSLATFPPSTFLLNVDTDGSQDLDSFAPYFQASYEFDNGLTITGGGRYTTDDRGFAVAQTFGPTTLFGSNEKSFSEFTPSFTVAYQVSPDLNIYAKAAKAFRAGSFNTNSTITEPVRPETLWQYEVGAKTQPTSNITFNIAAFITDYKDLQAGARVDAATVRLTNIGEVSLYGGEAELVWSATPDLNVYASGSYLHGEYDSFVDAQITTPTGSGGNMNAIVDLSGERYRNSPEYTFSIGGDYSTEAFGGMVGVNTNYYYASERDFVTGGRLTSTDVTSLRGSVGWSTPDDTLEISLFGENLLDQEREAFLFQGPNGDFINWAPPRTYGVRLRVKTP